MAGRRLATLGRHLASRQAHSAAAPNALLAATQRLPPFELFEVAHVVPGITVSPWSLAPPGSPSLAPAHPLSLALPPVRPPPPFPARCQWSASCPSSAPRFLPRASPTPTAAHARAPRRPAQALLDDFATKMTALEKVVEATPAGQGSGWGLVEELERIGQPVEDAWGMVSSPACPHACARSGRRLAHICCRRRCRVGAREIRWPRHRRLPGRPVSRRHVATAGWAPPQRAKLGSAAGGVPGSTAAGCPDFYQGWPEPCDLQRFRHNPQHPGQSASIQPSSAAVARSIVTCPTSPTGAKPRQPANDPDTRCTFSSCSCRQDVWEGLSPPQRRIVASELRSRKKTGVALEGEAQARFNAIKSELAELSTQ